MLWQNIWFPVWKTWRTAFVSCGKNRLSRRKRTAYILRRMSFMPAQLMRQADNAYYLRELLLKKSAASPPDFKMLFRRAALRPPRQKTYPLRKGLCNSLKHPKTVCKFSRRFFSVKFYILTFFRYFNISRLKTDRNIPRNWLRQTANR